MPVRTVRVSALWVRIMLWSWYGMWHVLVTVLVGSVISVVAAVIAVVGVAVVTSKNGGRD